MSCLGRVSSSSLRHKTHTDRDVRKALATLDPIKVSCPSKKISTVLRSGKKKIVSPLENSATGKSIKRESSLAQARRKRGIK